MATVNDLNPLSDISIGGVGQALLIFFFAIVVVGFIGVIV